MFAQLIKDNFKKLTFSLTEMQQSQIARLKEINYTCLISSPQYLAEGKLIVFGREINY